jgi:hypothetical protein
MSLGHSPYNHDRIAPTSTLTQHPNHSHSADDHVGPSPAPSEEIVQLARHLSTTGDVDGDLFDHEKGSSLDPFSENFNSRLWISKFANLEDWASGQDRRSGVSFKGMTVFGYGTDAGEQFKHITYAISTHAIMSYSLYLARPKLRSEKESTPSHTCLFPSVP